MGLCHFINSFVNSKMSFRHSIPLFLLCNLLCWSNGLAAQEVGAFIIVSIAGDVQVRDAAGEALPAADVAVGKSLFEGQTVVTSENSKVLLLLSNGTTVTLDAKGELLLDKFQQTDFKLDADTMVNDLEAEPSNSETKLKLGYGDLLFNVKKLNAGSSFDIESPVGNAGIRGTDGQLSVAVDPQTGNFSGGLNMLSGAVAFTSPAGNLINVPAGQAVQAQATPTGQQVGQVLEAPVPPPLTQTMTQSTEMAKINTANVRLGQVTEAVKEVGERIQKAPQRKESESQPDEPRTNPGETDAEPDEPKEEPTGKPRSANAPRRESKEELLEVDDKASLAQQGVVEEDAEAARKLKSLGLKQDDLKQLRKVDAQERKELVASDDIATIKKRVAERVEKENFIDEVKAKDPAGAQKVDFKNLSRDEVEHLASLDNRARKKLLKGDAESILESIQDEVQKEKLAKLDLDADALTTLNGYSVGLQKRIREDIDPDLARSLLKLHMPEAEMTQAVENLYASVVQNVLPASAAPSESIKDDVSSPVLELMELSEQGGNPQIVDILLKLGDGKLEEALLQLGREANDLLADMELTGELDSKRIVTMDSMRENPFFQDPVALADIFFLDDEVDGKDLNDEAIFVHPSKISRLTGFLDLYDFYANEQYLSLAATEHLEVSGEVQLDPISATHETYLSLLSAGTLDIQSGTSIIFLGDNLHVGSWNTMDVVNVSMEAGNSVGVHSMEDLLFSNSELKVRTGDEIFLSAQRDLRLNAINFPDHIRNIYLEATTIDLRNINFPGGSQVQMGTLYGGIDGKYPTFPGDPRQVGRVNFIENVQYDKNPLDNVKQFDQFGQNIHIHTRQQ